MWFINSNRKYSGRRPPIRWESVSGSYVRMACSVSDCSVLFNWGQNKKNKIKNNNIFFCFAPTINHFDFEYYNARPSRTARKMRSEGRAKREHFQVSDGKSSSRFFIGERIFFMLNRFVVCLNVLYI